jgi:hypothetical protein
MDVNKEFWKGFLRALGAEPGRPAEYLIGASGLNHPLVAYGLDEKLRRLIIISADADARSAALAQADLQNRYTDHKIIFGLPIAVNVTRELCEAFYARQVAEKRSARTLNDDRWRLNKFAAGDVRSGSVKRCRGGRGRYGDRRCT